jgi:hypothetical protein
MHSLIINCARTTSPTRPPPGAAAFSVDGQTSKKKGVLSVIVRCFLMDVAWRAVGWVHPPTAYH